jgi:DNA-binding transcriptional LysR family regulator
VDWDDVRLLLVLLEAGTLFEAGQRLGVDRSTVSRRLALLERHLGARLFLRSRDGLQPTAAAGRVRPFAEAMAGQATALKQAAQGADRAATGLVRLATTEAIATLLVERGLLSVREQQPGLALELLGSNRPVDLLRGEADLAVRVSPLRHASLRVRCVARLKVGLFASASYLARRGRPTTTGALRGHDVILPGGELAALPEARWLAARPGVQVTFRSNSLPALLAAAAQGLGLVPLAAAWADLDHRIERLQLLEEVPDRRLWLVTPPASATSPAVKVVGERIRSILSRF